MPVVCVFCVVLLGESGGGRGSREVLQDEAQPQTKVQPRSSSFLAWNYISRMMDLDYLYQIYFSSMV